jgi:hypothetical protein
MQLTKPVLVWRPPPADTVRAQISAAPLAAFQSDSAAAERSGALFDAVTGLASSISGVFGGPALTSDAYAGGALVGYSPLAADFTQAVTTSACGGASKVPSATPIAVDLLDIAIDRASIPWLNIVRNTAEVGYAAWHLYSVGRAQVAGVAGMAPRPAVVAPSKP